MRKILNNLWSQRTNNVWLFLELIVVCFVAWTQLDPIIVRLYYRSLPSGIDGERMVVANILSTQPYEMADESMTQEERDNQYWKREAQYLEEANVIKRQLLAIDGVEQASIADPAMGLLARTDLFGGSGYASKLRYAWQNDTVLAYDICYSQDEHFFETYGIRPIAGCKTSRELSDTEKGWIVSRSLAEHFFGSAEAAINKELKAASYVDIDWGQPIVAVVNDVHVSEKDYNTWAVYAYNGEIRSGGSQNLVVLRLKPGVNPRRFAEEQNLNPWNYASDHYAVASFTAYDDIGSARNQFAAPTLSYDFNLQIATALFFLVNLCLGVIGTFWMQTKRRTEESGGHHQHVHRLRALPQLREAGPRRTVHQPPRARHAARPHMGGRQAAALPHHLRRRVHHYTVYRPHRHRHPRREDSPRKDYRGAKGGVKDYRGAKGGVGNETTNH